MSDPPVIIPPPEPAVVTPPSLVGGSGGPELVPPSAAVVQEAVLAAPAPAEIAPATPATVPAPTPATVPAPPAATVPAPEPAQVPKPETPPTPRKPSPERAGGPLWLRRWNLRVGTNVGDKAVDLSALAFEFQVEKALNSTPYSAVITVYNIEPDLVTRMAKELTVVHLDAGYAKSTQYGEVFHGPIVYYKFGRKDATDTYVEIHALQQDVETNRSKANEFLPAGHTQTDVVKACLATMEGGRVKLGQYPDEMDRVRSPRGRVIHGMTRDTLRDVTRTFNATAHIADSTTLHILKEGEALQEGYESVPVLNNKSGLIGVPTQTLNAGVEIRSLLNPALNPGHQLKVAIKDINAIIDTSKENPSAGSGNAVATAEQLQRITPRANDGIYVVGTVRHWGHNRANPWYSDVSTKPVDPTKPGAKPEIKVTV